MTEKSTKNKKQKTSHNCDTQADQQTMMLQITPPTNTNRSSIETNAAIIPIPTLPMPLPLAYNPFVYPFFFPIRPPQPPVPPPLFFNLKPNHETPDDTGHNMLHSQKKCKALPPPTFPNPTIAKEKHDRFVNGVHARIADLNDLIANADTVQFPPTVNPDKDIFSTLYQECDDIDPFQKEQLHWLHKFVAHINSIEKRACCVCSELQIDDGSFQFVETIPNMSILKTQSPPPPDNNYHIFNGHFLNAKFITFDERNLKNPKHYCLCKECLDHLKQNKMPPVAIANGFDIGPIPEELKKLTIYEQTLLSSTRVRSHLIALKSIAGYRQPALKSHVCTFLQNVENITDEVLVFPLTHASVKTMLQICFIGSTRPTKKQLAYIFNVNRDTVRQAAHWWATHPSDAMPKFSIDENRFKDLPENDVPDELYNSIVHVQEADEEDNKTHSGYTTTMHDHFDKAAQEQSQTSPSSIPDHFTTHTAYVDTGARTMDDDTMEKAAWINLEETFRGCKDRHMRDKIVFLIPHSKDMLSHIHCTTFFVQSFPYLFTEGKGDANTVRSHKISFKRWVQHLLKLDDPRFRQQMPFVFACYNIMQREEILLKTYLKSKNDQFTHIQTTLKDKITQSDVENVIDYLNNPKKHIHKHTKERIDYLRTQLEAASCATPGTPKYLKHIRNDILSTFVFDGMPLLWITINPADVHNVLAVKLVKHDDPSVLNHFSTIVSADYRAQVKALSQNPYCAAEFFHQIVSAFFKYLIAVFGNVKNYYGVVEAQARGTLHIHFLVWIHGVRSLSDLVQRLQVEEFKTQFLAYANKIVRARTIRHPKIPDDQKQNEKEERKPPPDPEKATKKQLHDTCGILVDSSQMHSRTHNPTCFKKNSKVCRFRYPEKIRTQTLIETEDDKPKLVLERNEEFLVSYTSEIALGCQCNHNTTCMLQDSNYLAKALYMTTYMTKSDYTENEFYKILCNCMHRFQDMNDKSMSQDTKERVKQAVNIMQMQILKRTQVSASQAISYLMGWPDTYKKRKYTKHPQLAFNFWINKQIVSDDQAFGQLFPKDHEDVRATSADDKPDVIFTNQIDDYIYRPNELSQLCPYLFTCYTYKHTLKDNHDGHHTHAEETNGTHLQFHKAHPQHNTHTLSVSKQPVVPVLSFTPRLNNDHTNKQSFAKQMLLLFKPFRTKHDLFEQHANHWDAWTAYRASIEHDSVLSILIANILEISKGYTEKLALDQERMQDKNSFSENDIVITKDIDLFHEFTTQDEHALLHFTLNEHDDFIQTQFPRNQAQEIADAYSVFTTESNDPFVRSAQQTLQKANFFSPYPMQGLPLATDNATDDDPNSDFDTFTPFTTMGPCDSKTLKGVQSKAERKLKEDQKNDSNFQNNSYVRMFNAEDILVEKHLESDLFPHTIQSILENLKSKLNDKQEIAYKIASRHIYNTLQGFSQDQLFMYTGGSAGTGKSHILHAIMALLSTTNSAHIIKICAFTGSAAALIGGETIHHLFGMNIINQHTNFTDKQLSNLRDTFSNAKYTFIDEISFVPPELFAKMDFELQNAFKTDKLFGGVNIITAGDFYQMLPINSDALFQIPGPKFNHIVHNAHHANKEMKTHRGTSLWIANFKTCIILDQVMRQPDKDGLHTILEHAKERKCTEDDLNILKSRLISDYKVEDSDNVTFVTTRLTVRDQINKMHILSMSKKRKHPAYILIARLSYKENTNPDHIRQIKLATSKLADNNTANLPYFLGFYHGMPIMFTKNVNLDLGIANGSTGIFKQFVYDPNEYTIPKTDDDIQFITQMPLAAIVNIPGLKFHIPGLQRGDVLIFTYSATSKQLEYDDPDNTSIKHKTTVNIQTFPFVPAKAITGFKAEGKSLNIEICDMRQPEHFNIPKGHIYVCLSRTHSLKDLYLLSADITLDILNDKMPYGLENEMLRLRVLETNTLRAYQSHIAIDKSPFGRTTIAPITNSVLQQQPLPPTSILHIPQEPLHANNNSTPYETVLHWLYSLNVDHYIAPQWQWPGVNVSQLIANVKRTNNNSIFRLETAQFTYHNLQYVAEGQSGYMDTDVLNALTLHLQAMYPKIFFARVDDTIALEHQGAFDSAVTTEKQKNALTNKDTSFAFGFRHEKNHITAYKIDFLHHTAIVYDPKSNNEKRLSHTHKPYIKKMFAQKQTATTCYVGMSQFTCKHLHPHIYQSDNNSCGFLSFAFVYAQTNNIPFTHVFSNHCTYLRLLVLQLLFNNATTLSICT